MQVPFGDAFTTHVWHIGDTLLLGKHRVTLW